MERIIVLDFGSPATEFIARTIRQIGIYSEILPYYHSEKLAQMGLIKGLVLSCNQAQAVQAQTLAAKLANSLTLVYKENMQAEQKGKRAEWQTHELCFAATQMESGFVYDALKDFVLKRLALEPSWNAEAFVNAATHSIQDEVGECKVILGLSGGVDSSVVAALLHRAIGSQLQAIFVDTGLMRYQERARVQQSFTAYSEMKIDYIDASDLFLGRLKGQSDPEAKRKIIGHTFIEVFEREAAKYTDAKYLAQGTLYPDVIESVGLDGKSLAVKSHHNVGALPEKMQLKLIEPLRELFKDEVRAVGRYLGLGMELVERHPFPGPGLAVRILGGITPQKVKTLQAADEIFIQELRSNGLYLKTWQAFAVLLPVQSVGVKAGKRLYEQVCALRAVNSVDGLSANVSDLPLDFLCHVAKRISTEVEGISRVVYDITAKPPATIEWE